MNKLKGFSDCGHLHHVDSARFGWEWYQNQLLIYGYTYVNSVMKFTVMAAVPLNVDVNYDIKATDAGYVFTVSYPGFQNTMTMPRGCTGDGGLRYLLEPYFGGDETAPHNVMIRITD